jgi:hypothetical protein
MGVDWLMKGAKVRILSAGRGLVTAIRMIDRLGIPPETPSTPGPWGQAGWRQAAGQAKRHAPCAAVGWFPGVSRLAAIHQDW